MKILLLAGGEGNRLWPLTDPPKQFRSFGKPLSLLQQTLNRFLKRFPPKDLFIITNKSHANLASLQCKEVHPGLSDQLILETKSNNTAPAIAYALQTLGNECDDRILIAPADHYMNPEDSFLDRLFFAEAQLPPGMHGLFGVTPTFPHTGYGYMIPDSESPLTKAISFHEKPDKELASELIDKGALWNTGMILFHTETLLQQLPKEVPPISIDYFLLERAENLFVTHLDLSWSDLGSWEGIYAAHPKDEHGNVIFGNIETSEVENCLVMGGKEKKLLSNYKDSVVICSESCEYTIIPLGTQIPSLL